MPKTTPRTVSKATPPVLPGDLYRLRALGGCGLSPDGRWLATVVSQPDRGTNRQYSHVWLIPAQHGAPQQFTFGTQHDSCPSFSPDGRSLAFLSDRSGSSQVHVISLAGGESRQLSGVAGNVYGLAWSPDSGRLCLAVAPAQDKDAPAPVMHHFTGYSLQPPQPCAELHLLDVKSGRSRLMLRDDWHNYEPAFSPDGVWLVCCSAKQTDASPKHQWPCLRRLRIRGGGAPELVRSHRGPVYAPSVSPDGKWIAFSGYADPELGWGQANISLCVVPFQGGKVRYLSSALDRPACNILLSDCFQPWQSQPPLWSPDSRSLYTVVTDGGTAEVYRFNLEGGAAGPVVDEPGAVLGFDIDFTRQRIYYIHSGPCNPGDIYARSLTGGTPARRTSMNPWVARRSLGELRELLCPAGKGGPALEGWALLPPGFSARRKYPGILYIHGGPASAYGCVFVHEFHYLAGQGYVVFFCNPRGSLGYGVDFSAAIHKDWGNHDYRDLMRFTDHVLASCPFIDPARIGVTGGSYGGYMTNWIIGHTRRFKAAVTQRSVSNLLSWIGSSRGGFEVAHAHTADGKTPWQRGSGLLERSPLAHLESARTPTLVIHSEQDLAAPVEQGQQVYVQLKLQGMEAEYVRFPEEGHELSRGGRLDRRIERLKRICGWFDRFLKH